MASAPLIQLKDVALTFGGTPLLTGVELAVSEGDRVCLVGRNGSGKSTLFKIAAGQIEPDRGTRFVQPGATVRYLSQEPDFTGYDTALAYVEAGLTPGDDPYQAHYLIEQLGLTGEENPSHLSGGEARRVALARVLAPSPDILLLDEPTNHLDLPTIEWLEKELSGRRSALVLISHDRRFLSNISRSTVWLDRGGVRRIERGFASFEAWRDEVLAEEERDQHKVDRKIAREEDWLRHGVSGRRKRNIRRLESLFSLRAERRGYRGVAGAASITASEADKTGVLVIEAKNVNKSYDGRTIVRDFSARIQRGDRVGIVGPNGTGKTTLISLLTGALAPDSGMVRLGVTVSVAALDQSRDSLDPEATAAETLTGGGSDHVSVGGQPRHVASYLKDFLFSPEQARTPVAALSGGERGRLMLARALAKPSNLLVLDEPTNDLDLETLDVLQDMLGDYEGTVLLISHDRDFLDRLVTSVIVPEGDGTWVEYAGGYTDMLAQRGEDIARKTGALAEKREPKTNEPKVKEQKAKQRLSFNEKHALETLPKTIATLQDKIRTLSAQLERPDLYAKDRAKFEEISNAIANAHSQLSTAEEKWLELEILREELDTRA
jgi:ATP-binding cassette subfamily F protein uup